MRIHTSNASKNKTATLITHHAVSPLLGYLPQVYYKHVLLLGP